MCPGVDRAGRHEVSVDLGDENVRRHLAELGGVPIPPESEDRIAEARAYRSRSVEQWHHV
ncbi:MAG: hypothetical protein ACYDAQ_01445 [Mycobacteriales bacterium]